MILDIDWKRFKCLNKFKAVDEWHLNIHHDNDLIAIRWGRVVLDKFKRFPAVKKQADLFTHAGIKDHFLSDKTIQLIVVYNNKMSFISCHCVIIYLLGIMISKVDPLPTSVSTLISPLSLSKASFTLYSPNPEPTSSVVAL